MSGFPLDSSAIFKNDERKSLIIPDREAETAAQWMRHHPDITVVSRDRGSEYAKAAMLGAPQATQCADRFHIVKNLTEATQLILARCQEEIAAASKREEPCQNVSTKQVVSLEAWRAIRARLCGESAAGQTSGASHALSAGSRVTRAGNDSQRDCASVGSLGPNCATMVGGRDLP